jgi:hypothetical protein
VQVQLGDYVLINDAKDDEHGNEVADMVVARVVEIIFTINGSRRIGILWMYRIQVCLLLLHYFGFGCITLLVGQQYGG